MLLRHQNRDLVEGGLAFKHRLGRKGAVVAATLIDEGIERRVLILQRMHELVAKSDTV